MPTKKTPPQDTPPQDGEDQQDGQDTGDAEGQTDGEDQQDDGQDNDNEDQTEDPIAALMAEVEEVPNNTTTAALDNRVAVALARKVQDEAYNGGRLTIRTMMTGTETTVGTAA